MESIQEKIFEEIRWFLGASIHVDDADELAERIVKAINKALGGYGK